MIRVSAVLLAVFATFSPAMAAEPARVIEVTGEGRVAVVPDMATVVVGVTTEARQAAEAMTRNASAAARVVKALKGAGVEARELQTSALGLTPLWSREDQRQPRIVGYRATNMLRVKVRALDRLGALLDAVTQAGGNEIRGISLGLSDPAAAEEKARKRAVRDAIERADTLAAAAGVKRGPILSIVEGGGGAPRPMLEMATARAAAQPVAAGEVEVTATVHLTVAIEK